MCSIRHLCCVATELYVAIGGERRLLNTLANALALVTIFAMFFGVVAIAPTFVAVVIVITCADVCICM